MRFIFFYMSNNTRLMHKLARYYSRSMFTKTAGSLLSDINPYLLLEVATNKTEDHDFTPTNRSGTIARLAYKTKPVIDDIADDLRYEYSEYKSKNKKLPEILKDSFSDIYSSLVNRD